MSKAGAWILITIAAVAGLVAGLVLASVWFPRSPLPLRALRGPLRGFHRQRLPRSWT